MTPISFPGVNMVLAKNQLEYQQLPVIVFQDGMMLSCWKLTFWERIKILWHGKLWIQQLTFHQGFQPQLPTAEMPVITKKG